MLFVDLGAMDAELGFEYNKMGSTVLDLAVSRGW